MKPSRIFNSAVLLLALLCVVPIAAWCEEQPGKQSKTGVNVKFIDNGQVKIGVDLGSGGGISWFSELPAGANLLNHVDRGRLIQQSFYGNEDGSMWVKKPWRWNPVQGGDYKGNPAKLVEVKENDDTLYIKSIPMNWAGGELIEECRMEQWIRLSGPVVHVRYRFTYSGKTVHVPRHQELPAVFVDYDLDKLVYYAGDSPWTDADLKRDQPGWPNEQRDLPEEWAGYVGKDDRGVGVYFPGTSRITCYRYKGTSGPDGHGCSYFAPIRTIAVKPDFDFEYKVYLTIGSATEMRKRFASIRDKTPENAASQ